jgi:O-antigen/teichoic acid export membrane protein
MLRVLVRNIISNWVGYAVQILVVFFLTPFVVRSLGDMRYGIWVLVTGLTGYYGLLDLGFRAGITQYLTRNLATRDFENLNRTASTAFVALASCGALILLASFAVSWISPLIFNIPAETVGETRRCICIIGISTAIQFACFPFSAVFAATQRYDLSNILGISMRLVTAGATYAALRNGYGLVGITIINATGDMIGYSMRWRIAYRLVPGLTVSPRLANTKNLWALASFGAWSFVIQGAVQLRSYAGGLIVAMLLPITALTPYSLATGLIAYLDQIFSPLAMVFFPAATQLDAKGDKASLRRLYLIGSKALLLLGVTVGLIAVIWAKDFYTLWVGVRYVEGGEQPSVALLFSLLTVGAVAAIGQKIGAQVFLGTRWLRPLAVLTACEAVCNVLLTIALIRPFGLLGVVLGYAAAAIIFQGVLRPLVLCRRLEITLPIYLREVCARPLLVAGVLSAVFVLMRLYLPPAKSWGALFATGLAAGSISLVVLLALGVSSSEREQFLIQPLRGLRTRFS